jgi:hypothetical protein
MNDLTPHQAAKRLMERGTRAAVAVGVVAVAIDTNDGTARAQTGGSRSTVSRATRRHEIPESHQVTATPLLNGLHHEYKLEKRAA